MEKKWTYCAVYSIIQMHLVRGIVEETFGAEEHIYALPGSDVNLTCQTQKKGILVQMQWSKVTDKVDLLAVYHPQHGFYCDSKSACRSLVAFREPPGNVFEWTLYLRNVSSSTTGKYECSFTLYPEGIQTKIYSLKIQTNVAQEEWKNNHTIEIEINGTLEIPCFQNTSLEISSVLTFAWLVEDNGTQKTLTAGGHPISNSALFKDRVRIGTDYRLYLSPVQIHDDGWKFSCHVVVRPGRVLRSSTTVKVFAKPEIPMIVENNAMDVIGESIMRNAGLEETQAGIKIAGRNINNLRYVDDTTLMAESEEELESLLMKVKEESEKVGAQHSENEDHGIWSHHFLTNRWGNSGNGGRLYFGGAPKSLQMVVAAMKLKDTYSLEGKL